MAILPIQVFPAAVLKKKAKRVKHIDSQVQKLVRDMLETMHAVPGRIGLAAPQVGVPLRVIVIGVPEAEDIVLINPEIVRRKGERVIDEGCLSLPGFFAQVTRSESVTAKGLDQNGKEMRIKAEGLLAQALEHEIDHLNGTLYIDHLESIENLQKVPPPETKPEVSGD